LIFIFELPLIHLKPTPLSKDLHTNICNKKVFAKIYDLHAESLQRFLYYKFGTELQPGDKAQDAFIKLWERCADILPSKAKSFLYTTANNMMLNAAKHRKVVLQYQKVKPKDYTNETPEFLLRKEEFLVRYQEALSQLTEEQRTAFLLSKVEGKKQQEIAEMLGVTKKVVEYRIYSAFKVLKETLVEIKNI
jgi:RNA polymerase sigma-70 factor (ECF subfamily)